MRVLLAVDDSKYSKAATQMVLAQARPELTEVHVLHVIHILPQVAEMRASYRGSEHGRDAEREPAEALVAKTAELLRSKCLKVTTAVALGDPKSKILDAARKWHADLIVVGSHGRSAVLRFLLGSVSAAIARHAHCSVEIVRLAAKR